RPVDSQPRWRSFTMRHLLRFAAACGALWIGSQLYAQVAPPPGTPDADIRGPVRRGVGAAADAAGAPGVNERIEGRQNIRDERREDIRANANAARANATISDADRWRYVYHNNQWWYYTPQNNWMTYSNNSWSSYDPNTYVAPSTVVPRYTTGYYDG